jgi:hypothetical protein
VGRILSVASNPVAAETRLEAARYGDAAVFSGRAESACPIVTTWMLPDLP